MHSPKRSKYVAIPNTKPYKRLDYPECDQISSQFLTLLAGIIDLLSNKILVESFHQYICITIPVIGPFLHITNYIVFWGREEEINQYRVIVSRLMIYGRNFLKAHEELKHTMKCF